MRGDWLGVRSVLYLYDEDFWGGKGRAFDALQLDEGLALKKDMLDD